MLSLGMGGSEMEYATLQRSVPMAMVQFVEKISDEEVLRQNALMLYSYISNGTISHGRAAEILGIPKFTLIELYAKMGIPYINLSDEEIDSELEIFEELKKKNDSNC